MKLPIFINDNKDSVLMQNRWSSILNPVIANPINNVTLLESIPLKSGTNVINHKLGQLQRGWFLVDINAAATIYRSAAFNDLTLTLTSNATCIVSLGVF